MSRANGSSTADAEAGHAPPTENAPLFGERTSESDERRRKRILLIIGAISIIFGILVGGLLGRWLSGKDVHIPPGFDREGYGPCPEDAELECGYISVPRNHFNASQGEVQIYVARYRAPDPTRKLGTIWLNFGGPGNGAAQLAILMGKQLSRVLDGRYDIVGPDNRGTIGKTKPGFSCFSSIADRTVFAANTVLSRGFSVPPNPFSPAGREVLEVQMREWLTLTETQFKICQNAPGSEEIPFMGTPTVVRDFDAMTKKLDGEDALIHYWGPSYGSLLGSYLVNMLPHRVGRVVIDGVVRVDQWANVEPHKWLYSWLAKIEESFNFQLDECGKAGPEHCALAKYKGEGHATIGERLDGLLDDLYYAPVATTSSGRPGIITSGMARGLLYITTNYPKAFGEVAPVFAEAINGNFTLMSQLLLNPISARPGPIPGDTSRSLISCMDTVPYDPDRSQTWPSAADLVDESLRTLRDVSPRFAMTLSLFENDGGCQFLARTVQHLPERFTGPWNHTLRTPMLIMNNDLDPVTPLTSARWVNEQMGASARLVVVDKTPGHTTMFTGPSLCAARALRDYYVHGILPDAKETHCKNDETVFSHIHGQPDDAKKVKDQDLVDAVYEMRKKWYALFKGIRLP